MEDWKNAEKYAKLAQAGYTVMTAAQYTSHSEGFNKANDSWMLATHNVSTNTNIKDNDGDGSWGAKMTTEQGSGCGYGANYGYPFYIDRHLYETMPSTDCRKKCFVDFAVDTYTKKVTDPNATAQREKEKTTLWTRGKIVDVLSDKLPKLVEVTFKAYQTQLKKPLEDITSKVNFGEYANPSFEAQVETVGKGKTQGIMSIEASIDELYGDSKDDEWKQEEVKRLKNEQGIVDEVEIPAVNVPVKDVETGIDLKKEGVVNENKE